MARRSRVLPAASTDRRRFQLAVDRQTDRRYRSRTLAYRGDQTKAGQSGLHLMSFFANLLPLIDAARAKGNRVLPAGPQHGELGAAGGGRELVRARQRRCRSCSTRRSSRRPTRSTTRFEFAPDGRLSALSRLARRISIYSSERDDVLKLSMAVNLGAKRLGQDGPHDRANTALAFRRPAYRMVDCSSFEDYSFDLASSHQYYRRSPTVRTTSRTPWVALLVGRDLDQVAVGIAAIDRDDDAQRAVLLAGPFLDGDAAALEMVRPPAAASTWSESRDRRCPARPAGR